MSSRAQWPPSAVPLAELRRSFVQMGEGSRRSKVTAAICIQAEAWPQKKTPESSSAHTRRDQRMVSTWRDTDGGQTRALSWRIGTAVPLLWWRRSTGRTTVSFFHVFFVFFFNQNYSFDTQLGATGDWMLSHLVQHPPTYVPPPHNFSPLLYIQIRCRFDLSRRIGSLIWVIAVALLLKVGCSVLSMFVIREKSNQGIRTSDIWSVYRWR